MYTRPGDPGETVEVLQHDTCTIYHFAAIGSMNALRWKPRGEVGSPCFGSPCLREHMHAWMVGYAGWPASQKTCINHTHEKT